MSGTGKGHQHTNHRNERTGQLSDYLRRASTESLLSAASGQRNPSPNSLRVRARGKSEGAKSEEKGHNTGLSKSAERRTRGPSPHHHINVHVLQATIQIITNGVWLNPLVQTNRPRGRLWQQVEVFWSFFPSTHLPPGRRERV